jgi:hypothetical protein
MNGLSESPFSGFESTPSNVFQGNVEVRQPHYDNSANSKQRQSKNVDLWRDEDSYISDSFARKPSNEGMQSGQYDAFSFDNHSTNMATLMQYRPAFEEIDGLNPAPSLYGDYQDDPSRDTKAFEMNGTLGEHSQHENDELASDTKSVSSEHAYSTATTSPLVKKDKSKVSRRSQMKHNSQRNEWYYRMYDQFAMSRAHAQSCPSPLLSAKLPIFLVPLSDSLMYAIHATVDVSTIYGCHFYKLMRQYILTNPTLHTVRMTYYDVTGLLSESLMFAVDRAHYLTDRYVLMLI